MFRTTKSVAARVYAFVNAAVVLLVPVGMFTGLDWGRMPEEYGLEETLITQPFGEVLIALPAKSGYAQNSNCDRIRHELCTA